MIIFIFLLIVFSKATSTVEYYKYLDYDEIISSLHTLKRSYPNILTLQNAQDNDGVPSPGSCGNSPCKQWYLTINDKVNLPEVFFSGAVHGNERVGPTATVELLKFLLKYSNSKNKQTMELDTTQRWFSRLLKTRSITIMPNANALGYYENVREENGVDPNRDFPWGVSPENCMKTTAARALNSLFREHMFQISITFHGGMRAIAYEWGSPNFKAASPDDGALEPLGVAASHAAGAGDRRNGGYYYPASWLNPLVYPVKGGMEDWAYAASFDQTGYNQPCNPIEYGGYPREMTTYKKDQLRTFNFLVETADDKVPVDQSLGFILSPSELLKTNSRDDQVGGGHIPRNMRLMLFMIDLVEPYVEWFEINQIDRALQSKQNTFQWDVGGSLHVDDTALFVLKMKSEDCPSNSRQLDLSKATRIEVLNTPGGISKTIWSRDTSNSTEMGNLVQFIGRYRAQLPEGLEGSKYIIVAGAKVDQSWGVPLKKDYEPKGMSPQSHLVQARTSNSYQAVNGEKKITGHLWWYSSPKCVEPKSVGYIDTLKGEELVKAQRKANEKEMRERMERRKSVRLRRSMMYGSNTWLTRI
jgi:hypothetical protein